MTHGDEVVGRQTPVRGRQTQARELTSLTQSDEAGEQSVNLNAVVDALRRKATARLKTQCDRAR